MLRSILRALGMLGILISLPLLAFAVMAFIGILADIGPAENRGLGIQLLYLGLPILFCGLVLCVAGLRVNTSAVSDKR